MLSWLFGEGWLVGASAQIDRNISDAISGNVARGVTQAQLSIRGREQPASFMATSSDHRYLATLLADGAIRVWDLEIGAQRRHWPRGTTPASVVLPVSRQAGFVVAVGRQDGKVDVLDGLSAREIGSATLHGGPVRLLAASMAGDLIATAGDDRTVKLWAMDGSVPATLATDTAAASLAFDETSARLLVGTEDGGLKVFDLQSRRLSADARLQAKTPLVAGALSKGAAVMASADGRIATWNLQAPPRLVGSATKTTRAIAIEPTAGIAAFGYEDGKVRLLSLDGSVRETKVTGGAVLSLALARGGARLLAGTRDGSVRLLDTRSGRELLQLVSTTSGWTVIDNQGRFDGSEGGLAEVSWAARGFDLTLESFSRRYFEPGMLATYLNGTEGSLRTAPASPATGVKPPPVVEIDLPETPKDANKPFMALVVAEDRGTGIQALRLYHNGKLVDPGTLQQEQQQTSNNRSFRVAAYHIQPTPGVNTLRAIAVGEHDIEGVSKRETLQLPGQTPPSILHIVTIGINEYRARELRLDFARVDAETLATRLQGAAAGVFSDIRVHRLLDAQATKPAILAKLESLTSVAPHDVVVLYLAGHGVLAGDEWVFLTQEVPFRTDSADYLPFGLTGTALQAALVKIKAQKILTAIDSCHSGGLKASFDGAQGFHRRLFREVSRASGVTILAATRPDQSAAELPRLGHGVFTHVTLQGLAGGADLDRKGFVTAHGLSNFVADRLPAISREHLGVVQEPSAYALGADFVLGRVQN